MSYLDIIRADVRLAVLQLLEEDPGYSHNDAVLKRGLSDLRAHEISSDMLRTELAWLAEQGLVELREVADLYLVKLTSRGEDVALGRVLMPGVARPRP